MILGPCAHFADGKAEALPTGPMDVPRAQSLGGVSQALVVSCSSFSTQETSQAWPKPRVAVDPHPPPGSYPATGFTHKVKHCKPFHGAAGQVPALCVVR